MNRRELPPSDARMLCHAVARACPRALWSQREDIAQTALTRVVARLRDAAEPPELTRAYLCRVARNAVCNELRRTARASHGHPPPPRTRTIEDDYVVHELLAITHEAVERLPPPRAVAVRLHLQGHGLDEIADRCGWTRKRADNLVHRGLATVRDALRNRLALR